MELAHSQMVSINASFREAPLRIPHLYKGRRAAWGGTAGSIELTDSFPDSPPSLDPSLKGKLSLIGVKLPSANC